MHEEIKRAVRDLLATGKIEGFLALKQDGAHVGPHLFVQADEVEHLVIGDESGPGRARYPLLKIVQTLLQAKPNSRFGVLVRGCDERALKALLAWNQIADEQIITLGVACPSSLAKACQCAQPYPEKWLEGEATETVEFQGSPLEKLSPPERLFSWLEQFEKCIKCYGCRNICPMCFCNECALESEDVVSRGEIPPEFPMFHLVRALHMIGRCVDCGLCEEACPADIPLRTLYKKINDIVDDHFRFRPGFNTDKRSPLHEVAEPPPTR
ncbi:MAG: 4Fe-4S dicluster domain-containing protein [Deltaproteobacteria bacterium]|nr:4Fe-4S dicluster domain-containing protein [Deltaproteobacteria bacterium]MBW2070548.1 4Fe-4S dicluster domain-containing protein [Deltaproteobacteria bacterium]